CLVGRVLVEREPAGGIHQISLVLTDVSQTLGEKRPTVRRVQNSAVLEPKGDRGAFCDIVAEIDPDAGAEIGDADLVLNECDRRTGRGGCLGPRIRGSGCPIDARDGIDLQRAVQLKGDVSPILKQGERDIRCRRQLIVQWFKPGVYDVMRYVKRRPLHLLSVQSRKKPR